MGVESKQKQGVFCLICLQYTKSFKGFKGRIRDETFSYLWNTKFLQSANFFAWHILKGRVATKENLCRGWIIQADMRCPLYTSHTESIKHLFFWAQNRMWSLEVVIDGSKSILLYNNHPKDNFCKFQIELLNKKENWV